MVTCNLCLKNLKIEKMQTPYRYVCKKCFKKLKVFKDGEEVNKELLY